MKKDKRFQEEFTKKYRKIENTLDIAMISDLGDDVNFYIRYKSVYRTYFWNTWLKIIISFKVKDNQTKLEYFYDYQYRNIKKFKVDLVMN